MKEIRAFVEREAKFVFAHLLENKGITAKRRQIIEERSIDYAVNLLPRKEIFDDVIMMTQPGCIAAVSMARFGPHYLVALSDDFPMTAEASKCSFLIVLMERRNRGQYLPKSNTSLVFTRDEYSDTASMFHESIDYFRPIDEKFRGLTVDSEMPGVVIERPKDLLSRIGAEDKGAIVASINQHIHTALDNTFSDFEPDAMNIISSASRFVGGMLGEYGREFVRKATHIETLLVQTRSNLAGRVEELIASTALDESRLSSDKPQGFSHLWGMF